VDRLLLLPDQLHPSATSSAAAELGAIRDRAGALRRAWGMIGAE
jgi:hypothetical protein